MQHPSQLCSTIRPQLQPRRGRHPTLMRREVVPSRPRWSVRVIGSSRTRTVREAERARGAPPSGRTPTAPAAVPMIAQTARIAARAQRQQPRTTSSRPAVGSEVCGAWLGLGKVGGLGGADGGEGVAMATASRTVVPGAAAAGSGESGRPRELLARAAARDGKLKIVRPSTTSTWAPCGSCEGRGRGAEGPASAAATVGPSTHEHASPRPQLTGQTKAGQRGGEYAHITTLCPA